MDDLHQLKIQNYRSLKDLHMPIGNPCLITGANGTGKSNLYGALALLQAASKGQFARSVIRAGGMPSLLWAGSRTRQDKSQLRVGLSVSLGSWQYELKAGLPTLNEGAFALDPRVKEERLDFVAGSGRKTAFLKRAKLSVTLRDVDNSMQARAFEILGTESALSQIAEPQLYPELSRLRDALSGWRFYHHFDTRAGSALRQAQIGTMTPLLATDGADLPSALASIQLLGDFDALAEAFDKAFPGHELLVIEDKGQVSFKVQQPGLLRPLSPEELSDGTLHYICLLAALKGLQLPTLMVLNEPEMSLHQDLLVPLADLISAASQTCQVIVVTHASTLCERVAGVTGVSPHVLIKQEGATKTLGQRWDGSLSGGEGL